MSEYYTVVTQEGLIELLGCMETGVPFPAVTMSIGDSNGSYYEPSIHQTELKNPKYSGTIFKQGKVIKENGGYLYFCLQIPPSEGDYYIREVGVFDKDNNLLAVSKYPLSFKQKATDDNEKNIIIEIQIQLSTDAIVQINVDDSGNLADTDLSNLSEEGIKVIKKNSSSVFELCDIGMSLYIDETKGLRRRLNGQIVDINTNTQAFLTKLQSIIALYPTLACTESEWQAAKTLSAFGQVGKFVLNYAADGTTVESVRLPAVVNVQGLLDLSKLGMTVDAGLPNITGTKGTLTSTGGDTSLYGGTKEGHYASTDATTPSGLYHANLILDASKSSPIYGNSDTVQQEAVLFPYFIQIATGQETENNIVNTLENNIPISLFKSEYDKYERDDASWLASNGQWNAKTVYATAYEALVVEHNTEIAAGTTVTLPSGTSYIKRGLNVKLSTETYTDEDFVINPAGEKFILPLSDGSENLPGDNAEILTLSSSGQTFTAPKNGKYVLSVTASSTDCFVGLYNESTGEQLEDYIGNTGDYSSVSVEAKRGDTIKVSYRHATIRSFIFIPYVGNGKLYYYVGETVQNAHLINAGRFAESLADKVDIANTEWAVNACMPDYSAGIDKGLNFISDGYYLMYINARWNNTAAGSASVNTKINDTVFSISLNYAEHTQYNFYLKPGDIVKVTLSHPDTTTIHVNCYPLGGGNNND